MSSGKPLIVMVEDDEDMAYLNADALKDKGYDVLLAVSAAEAQALARANTPDLFILDVSLPDANGYELCKDIRRSNSTPIIFLTGKKQTNDIVAGLNAGGDYYLTKPYVMEEFITVVQATLRRATQNRSELIKAVSEATVITQGVLTLNLPQRKAFVNGRDTELTAKEFAVLLVLVQNEDKELSGETIYQSVWGMTANNGISTVQQHISRLKKKLGADDTDSFDIVNKYGGSYTFTTK